MPCKMGQNEYCYTVQPKGAVGVKMKRDHYRGIGDFILEILDAEGQCTINDLIDMAKIRFGDQFKQEIGWHIYKVKLDMEARGILKNKRCEMKRINYIVTSRKSKTRKSFQQFPG
jgi:hypothetical protein